MCSVTPKPKRRTSSTSSTIYTRKYSNRPGSHGWPFETYSVSAWRWEYDAPRIHQLLAGSLRQAPKQGDHLGFTIEAKQKKYVLTITAESVVSTDERFTMDDLSSGENYKPLDVYFKKANGDIVKRSYNKGERKNSNLTLPRLACQIFERQLADLSVEAKECFPVCKYITKKWTGRRQDWSMIHAQLAVFFIDRMLD